MKRLSVWGVALAVVALAGCKKTDNSKINFTAAINTYYTAHPACLWSDPVKFPVQADTSDTTKTQGYDALVDQGLLQRTTGEKKILIFGSKQVTNYDISDKGRGFWTPDATEPGTGNFCYGKPKVTSIDSFTPNTQQPGATSTVNYHVAVADVPGWASAAETQNAFPAVRTELAGPMPGIATLTDTSNGWTVTSGPAHQSGTPASTADGKTVQ